MKDINKYGRNNRTCISSLDVNHLFDYTDPEYFYLCNDMLNLSHIIAGDLIRFNLLDTDNEMYKIFGFVIMACNMGKTTFLVCRHYDDTGKEYIQDYKYSSFNHAFEKINDHHDGFVRWERLTNNKDVKTPQEVVDLWLEVNCPGSMVQVRRDEQSTLMPTRDPESKNMNLGWNSSEYNNCNNLTDCICKPHKQERMPTMEELVKYVEQINDRLRVLEIEHGR